ncbi:MAG: hypothetical protein SynsKO_23220 [Synoicihabitans sp.]
MVPVVDAVPVVVVLAAVVKVDVVPVDAAKAVVVPVDAAPVDVVPAATVAVVTTLRNKTKVPNSSKRSSSLTAVPKWSKVDVVSVSPLSSSSVMARVRLA